MNDTREKYCRFSTPSPTIGIRPTIDGRRRGVRESLEEQTMALANSVKSLLENELQHPDGTKVECVMAPSTIGGIAEAAACETLFSQERVGLSITVTPCWCYGTETMDMDPLIPKAIWGFNGTERPGAVYLAAVLAAHAQKGLPAFGIYGRDVQDADDSTIPADVRVKLLQFASAGLAVARMKGKSYLGIGGVSMGIAGSILVESFFQEYLGMRNEYVDMSEISRRLELGIYDSEEFEKAIAWVKAKCQEGPDLNEPGSQRTRQQKDGDWNTVVKMAMITRDLMVGNPVLASMGFKEESLGHEAIVAGFQGQRHWTDFMPNGDFLETILNSSFDWNGIRQPFIVATENDSLNGICMLFGHLLTNTAQVFADVRTFWSPEAVERVTGQQLEGNAAGGIIHLINSGSACLDATGQQEQNGIPTIKPFWKITQGDIDRCLDATRFCPAIVEYFRGGGFSTSFTTKGGMPMTMSRLNLVKGLGPVLQIAEGMTIKLPSDMHAILDERTNPTWPTSWFAPRLTGRGAFTSVHEVMSNWGANHAAVCFGHVGAELLTLASMLRIPVNMHNVPTNRVFRPSTWSAFGTDNLEGADFRACRALGPLYR